MKYSLADVSPLNVQDDAQGLVCLFLFFSLYRSSIQRGESNFHSSNFESSEPQMLLSPYHYKGGSERQLQDYLLFWYH